MAFRALVYVPRIRAALYDGIGANNTYIAAWLDRKAFKRSLSGYAELICQVRQAEYPIAIKLGLDVCFFREAGRFPRDITAPLGLDFLVGSVHFVGDFGFDHTAELWDGVDVDDVYRRYFEESVALAESGVYDGLAHPDSIKLFGHKPSFSLLPYYERLAATLAKRGMYVEMNSGCNRRTGCGPGMDAELLRVMKQHGVRILTASDAHTPKDTGAGIAQLEALIENA